MYRPSSANETFAILYTCFVVFLIRILLWRISYEAIGTDVVLQVNSFGSPIMAIPLALVDLKLTAFGGSEEWRGIILNSTQEVNLLN